MCEAVYGGTCDCKCMTFWKSLDLRLQRLVFEEFKNSFRRQKSQFFHGKYEKSQIAPYILPQSQKTQVHRRTENMRTTTWDNDVVWHVTGERKRVLRRVTVVWLVCGIGAVRNVAGNFWFWKVQATLCWRQLPSLPEDWIWCLRCVHHGHYRHYHCSVWFIRIWWYSDIPWIQALTMLLMSAQLLGWVSSF